MPTSPSTIPKRGISCFICRFAVPRGWPSATSGAVTLRPGVATVIRAARAAGLRLAVATTTSPHNVVALCRACWGQEADDIFDVVAAGDAVAAKKPAPDIYRLALDRLDLGPAEAIAIEDSRIGMRAARAAGLAVLVTPSAYTAGEDFSGADWVRPDLTGWRPPGLAAQAWQADRDDDRQYQRP
jgi:HAD superfamily hydrolase (TIGR01509 family)